MTVWWIPILISLAVLAYVARELFLGLGQGIGGIKPEKLPVKLKNAARFTEGQICTKGFGRDLIRRKPYKVRGRPDLLFQLENTRFVPVDHKRYRTHREAYPDEIAQLSLYAWLLRGNDHLTANFGFLALETSKGSRQYDYIEVELLGDAETEAMVARHEALIFKKVSPRIERGSKCNRCNQKISCQ